jgi:hypothetical protein
MIRFSVPKELRCKPLLIPPLAALTSLGNGIVLLHHLYVGHHEHEVALHFRSQPKCNRLPLRTNFHNAKEIGTVLSQRCGMQNGGPEGLSRQTKLANQSCSISGTLATSCKMRTKSRPTVRQSCSWRCESADDAATLSRTPSQLREWSESSSARQRREGRRLRREFARKRKTKLGAAWAERMPIACAL